MQIARRLVSLTPIFTGRALSFFINHHSIHKNHKSISLKKQRLEQSPGLFSKESRFTKNSRLSMSSLSLSEEIKTYVPNLLFVEIGFGNDSHGQSATKAACRACRNAIEFNQLPSISTLIPGGIDKMELCVILAIPSKYKNDVNLQEVAKVFPYGNVNFILQDGGMIAPSGKVIEDLGDMNGDDMVIVCCSVNVGY